MQIFIVFCNREYYTHMLIADLWSNKGNGNKASTYMLTS